MPLICDVCNRMMWPDWPYADWWLDGLHPGTRIRVTRCPQHISTWALRQAGMTRSKHVYQWARTAKERDDPAHDYVPPW